MRASVLLAFSGPLSFLLVSPAAQSVELSGFVGVQPRWFDRDAFVEEQDDLTWSFNLQPEWYQEWDQGRDALTFKPYLRIDSADQRRSHADIRELYWLHVEDNWEFGAGISKVFWGVTESQHLVDIINQTDLVEAPDGEEKLGQPMLRWSRTGSWGVLDLFLLPGFRPRTFPGFDGRLRGPLVIDLNDPEYESGADERHVDIAARWVNSISGWDIGASVFRGTSREPEFIAVDGDEGQRLRPYYSQIVQYGLDAQWTTGAWLLKFEGIARRSDDRDYAAATGGFEYTYWGVLGGPWDLGLLAEYSYDSRDAEASSGLQNDLFIGARWSFNDAASSEILLGVTGDLEDSDSVSGRLEASTRLGESTKLYFEYWHFDASEPVDPFYPLRRDPFFELTIEYYF